MSKVEPLSTQDEPYYVKNGRLGWFKLLIATAIFLFLACSGLIAALIVREYQRTETQTQCMNKACVEAAFRLQQNMNVSEKPCNNFYHFACGGWEKRNVIPDDNVGIGTFNFIRDDLVIAVKNVLDQPESQDDIPTTQLSKRFYSSCMNRASNEERGVQTLQAVAAAVGGLPIITDNYNPDSRTLIDMYSYAPLYSAMIKNPFIFSYSVDAKDSSKYLIKFDQPSSLGLPSFDMYKDQQKYSVQITAYKALLTNYVRLLQDDFNITVQNISTLIDDFVQFETIVAKASVTSGLRRSISDVYNLTSLDTLEQLFSQFNWRDFVIRVFDQSGAPILLTKDFNINLASYSFFSQVADSLFNPNIKKTVSYMHLFSALNAVIRHLPKKYRKVYSDFSEIVYDTDVEKPRFKECHDIVNGYLSHAIGRMFIDTNFPEEAKSETLSMIKMIVNAFAKLIEKNSWMDEETRNAAKKKLTLIQNRIGYPDWTRNNAKLTDYYYGLNLKKDDFLINNLLAMYKWSSKQFFAKYSKSIDRTEWITSAAIVNAFYYSSYNTINFPAGILQPPFFHKDYPRYLNFGAIGMVIGHEITHGFDDQGRQYDGMGNVSPWWKPSIVEKFKVQAQCLINQYGNFKAPNGMNLNGVQTQGENIADNGGIKQTFEAYREWVRQNGGKEELKLPGLDFTPNQLLFLNFASVWCHKDKMSSWRDRILTGVHSPGTFRVIGSLQNSPDFQAAFNCQKNDYMNKEDKCTVW